MFTSIDKALVALIMAVIYLVNTFTPVDFGVSHETVANIVAIITPVLVYLIPNKAY